MNNLFISLDEAKILFNKQQISHQNFMVLAIKNVLKQAIKKDTLYAQTPGLSMKKRDAILAEIEKMLRKRPHPTSAYKNIKADMEQFDQYQQQLYSAGCFKKFFLAFKIKRLKQKEYPLQEVLCGLFNEFNTINRVTVLELVGNDLIVDEDEEI